MQPHLQPHNTPLMIFYTISFFLCTVISHSGYCSLLLWPERTCSHWPWDWYYLLKVKYTLKNSEDSQQPRCFYWRMVIFCLTDRRRRFQNNPQGERLIHIHLFHLIISSIQVFKLWSQPGKETILTLHTSQQYAVKHFSSQSTLLIVLTVFFPVSLQTINWGGRNILLVRVVWVYKT